MGLFFEEFFIGQKFISPRRTITETDVVNFAGLSGDFNPLHTDMLFAKQTPYGKRIAHGMLLLSIMTGLTDKMGIFNETVLALMQIDNWQFIKPVFFNDTIYLEMEILDKQNTKKTDRGIVVRRVSIINQNDDIVQRGEIKVMMKKRETNEQTT